MTETAFASPNPPSDVPRLRRRLSARMLVVLAAVLACAAGGWLRIAHLNDPMRNDEAFTALVYVKRGDYFNYSRPNNHILNTLLMAAVSDIAGDSPANLRLPAFLFGMLLIPAVGLLTFQLCRSAPAAIASMALAASSPALVEYSVNARGYSLVAFAAVTMACLTGRLRESPRWIAGWVLWALWGVAGLYAIPVMVYVIAPLIMFFLMDPWPAVKTRLIPLGISFTAIGISTVLLYSPVIAQSGVASIFANPFVTPSALSAIPAELVTRCGDIIDAWGRSPLFLLFLCAGTLLSAVYVAWRGGNRLLLLAFVAIVIAVVAAFAQRRVAPARVYLYIQAWMIACACAGPAQLLKEIPWRRNALQAALVCALILLATSSWFHVKSEPLLISEDPHTFVEAKQVAAQLIALGADRPDVAVIWNSAENLWPPFLYYFVRLHPTGGYPISWNDPGCKIVFFLLGPTDNIADLVARKPAFLQMYDQPNFIQQTINSRIYLSHRR